MFLSFKYITNKIPGPCYGLPASNPSSDISVSCPFFRKASSETQMLFFGLLDDDSTAKAKEQNP
jgi:hypothetical protein